MKENKKREKSFFCEIPLFSKIFYLVTLAVLAITAVYLASDRFADFFNENISSAVRIFLAKLTGVLPFSLAEAAVILSPVLIFLAAWWATKKYSGSWRDVAIFCVSLLSVLSIFLSLFLVAFAPGYHGSTLDKKLGLERRQVSAEELYETAVILRDKINAETENMRFGDDGFSEMPYGIRDMNKKLIEAYDAAAEKYDFINSFSSRLKPVMLSKAMSYAHITGVYTFFTGEANINVDFPDYTIPYTAAHELAHQRGIAREDEANFVAYLVCIESDDAYVRYSAYLNLYEYVASALWRADKELYAEMASALTPSVKGELRAYSEFFDKYRDSVVSEISGAVNNTYLTIQGTAGTASYGMVVDLAVAYYKK